MNEIFQLPSADVYGAFTTPVVLRSDMLSNFYYGSLWMGERGLDIFCLFNKKPCEMLLCFLGYDMLGSSHFKQFVCMHA